MRTVEISLGSIGRRPLHEFQRFCDSHGTNRPDSRHLHSLPSNIDGPGIESALEAQNKSLIDFSLWWIVSCTLTSWMTLINYLYQKCLHHSHCPIGSELPSRSRKRYVLLQRAAMLV